MKGNYKARTAQEVKADAVEGFFSAMPADIGSDMAFVLVQHLAPDYLLPMQPAKDNK
jgi:hypothetical protein